MKLLSSTIQCKVVWAAQSFSWIVVSWRRHADEYLLHQWCIKKFIHPTEGSNLFKESEISPPLPNCLRVYFSIFTLFFFLIYNSPITKSGLKVFELLKKQFKTNLKSHGLPWIIQNWKFNIVEHNSHFDLCSTRSR